MLSEQQKIKILKQRGAEWYVKAVKEIEKAKQGKKPGGSNEEVL